MENLFIDTRLISDSENHHITGDGVLNNGIITYNEDLVHVSINLNDSDITLIRRHPEYEIKLRFSENEKRQGSYLLKEVNRQIIASTITKNIIKEDGKIEIVYDLFLDEQALGEYKYTLNYEVK